MPEPVLISIAAALAGKAATSLYDLVRRKLGERGTVPALEAAEGAGPDSAPVAVLADELADAERDDPAFGAELRSTWNVVQQADNGAVINQIHGDVHGKALQARDIHGDVRF